MSNDEWGKYKNTYHPNDLRYVPCPVDQSITDTEDTDDKSIADTADKAKSVTDTADVAPTIMAKVADPTIMAKVADPTDIIKVDDVADKAPDIPDLPSWEANKIMAKANPTNNNPTIIKVDDVEPEIQAPPCQAAQGAKVCPGDHYHIHM